MKNLLIIDSCLVNGEHAEAGTTLKNVDNAVAADLIVSGRAVIAEPAAEPAVETRDPAPESRDTPVAKKRKTK